MPRTVLVHIWGGRQEAAMLDEDEEDREDRYMLAAFNMFMGYRNWVWRPPCLIRT